MKHSIFAQENFAQLAADRAFPAVSSQDRGEIRQAAAARVARLRRYLADAGMDGFVISRRDNFAWLTCGGDSQVLRLTEHACAHLLVTPDAQYLLAYTMDAGRLLDEQIPGQGYTPVVSKWYEGDPRQKAVSLAGGRLCCDVPFPGMKETSLLRMHGPMEGPELARLRWLGRCAALVYEELPGLLHPGMTELEIARLLHAALALNAMEPAVLITGSDERIGRYWHALPSEKPVRQTALVHAAPTRWGLTACINRTFSFGPPPEALRGAYHAAATIEGRIIGMLRAGLPYASILESQMQWYAQLGYPDDWKYHFQGGPLGYYLGDPTRCMTDMLVEDNQAFDWFITVQGVQVEELTLMTQGGMEILSLSEGWPSLAVETEAGSLYVPDIFVC